MSSVQYIVERDRTQQGGVGVGVGVGGGGGGGERSIAERCIVETL